MKVTRSKLRMLIKEAIVYEMPKMEHWPVIRGIARKMSEFNAKILKLEEVPEDLYFKNLKNVFSDYNSLKGDVEELKRIYYPFSDYKGSPSLGNNWDV